MNIYTDVDKAIIYTKEKKYSKAEEIYKNILKIEPNNSVILSMLGLLYLESGALKKAEKTLMKSYSLKESVPTIEGLAIIKSHLKRKDSVNYFKKVIDRTKNFEIFNKYINYLLDERKYRQACEYAEKSIKLFPMKKEAYTLLVECYINTGRLMEAFNHSVKITSIYPKYSDGWLWLGLCYEILFHDDIKAEECFQKVLTLGNKSKAYLNLAINAYKQDNPDKSIFYTNKLRKLKNNKYNTDFSLAVAYMKKRNFKKGLKYYSRYIHVDAITKSKSKISRLRNYWDGKTYKNDTLFIWGDQGIGDLIMFSRYIPYVSKKFKKVKVLVRAKIVDLFKTTFKEYKNVSFYTKKIPSYDKCAIMSCLADYLNMDYSSIPAASGYFKVNKKYIEKYKRIIDSKKLKVGICWEAGASGWREQLNRTLHVSFFESIINADNVQCYSLQVNPTLDSYKDYKNLIDLGKDFKSFSDTAGALKNLDLLITVDTSVAHLAGALGVKTFMLLPYCPDWRWFNDDKTTNWYKSITIFKQKNPKSWEELFKNIEDELKIFTKQYLKSTDNCI